MHDFLTRPPPPGEYRGASIMNLGSATQPVGTIYLEDGYRIGFGAAEGVALGGGLWRLSQTPDWISDATLAHLNEVLARHFPDWSERPARLAVND